MKAWLLLALTTLLCTTAVAQKFVVNSPSESIRTIIGETTQASLRIRNNDSKALTLVIRKIQSNLGSTQKSYYCLNGNCNDTKTEEIAMRLEPDQVLSDLYIGLDAGLSSGISSVRYSVYNKANPSESVEFDLNVIVDEMTERKSVYNSKFITLHDVYPNPAIETAHIDYKIHLKEPTYTITIRNLLGNVMSKYTLETIDSKIKIRTDELNTGIYFFTLYIDNEGVMTRKMMVKK
jgi:hypothetical protein